MKKLLFISIIAFVLGACNQSNAAKNTSAADSLKNKSADIKTTPKDSVYGVAFDYKSSQLLTDLMKDPSDLDTTKDYTVLAVVTTVCQKAGCWFRAEDGKGSDVFIKIVSAEDKEEEATIPMTTPAGTNVVFYGTPKLREVSVKTQRHYAEDAGKSKAQIEAIKKPKMEWRFFATGVVVKA
jgi:hypothetical protein